MFVHVRERVEALCVVIICPVRLYGMRAVFFFVLRAVRPRVSHPNRKDPRMRPCLHDVRARATSIPP